MVLYEVLGGGIPLAHIALIGVVVPAFLQSTGKTSQDRVQILTVKIEEHRHERDMAVARGRGSGGKSYV